VLLGGEPEQIVDIKTGYLESLKIGNVTLEHVFAYLADAEMSQEDSSLEYILKNGFAFLGVNGFFDQCKVWISFKDKWLCVQKYEE
jgi:hypothetical protein